MVNVHIDPGFDDDERRRRLFGGDVLVYTHVPEIAAFAAYTREMITELFAPHDPPHDQHGVLPRGARRHADRVQAALDPRPASR